MSASRRRTPYARFQGVSVFSRHCSVPETRSARSASQSHCDGSRTRLSGMLEPSAPACRPIRASRVKGGASAPSSEGSGAQTLHVLEVTSVEARIDTQREGQQSSNLGNTNRCRRGPQPQISAFEIREEPCGVLQNCRRTRGGIALHSGVTPRRGGGRDDRSPA